jgi:uncharacterized protein with PQ loop repeat
MNMTGILGLTGTVIGLIRALPQLLRLLRSKEALGVSVDTALTSSIVSFGWATYGYLTQQPYVTLATGSSGVVFLAIAVCALKFGRKIREIKVTPGWFCILLFAFLIKGEVGLGIILPISILVSNIPQIYVAVREQDLTDLSLGTWILSMSDGLVWGLYAMIENDYSIMVFAFFQLVTSGAVTFLKLSDRKKQLICISKAPVD